MKMHPLLRDRHNQREYNAFLREKKNKDIVPLQEIEINQRECTPFQEIETNQSECTSSRGKDKPKRMQLFFTR